MAFDKPIKEEILSEIPRGTKGDILRTTRMEFDNNVVKYDIRIYYLDTKGELKPTPKGFRASSEDMVEVMKCIYNSFDEAEVTDFIMDTNLDILE